MQTFKILSTKVLAPELKSEVQEHIDISEIEMIKVKPIESEEKVKEIEYWLSKNLPLIFTSGNAGEIIIQLLKQQHIELSTRTIYCLSGKTQLLLKQQLPNFPLISANNATQLADKVLNDQVKEIVFFCGDIRRNELPDALKKKNIQLHEVVVYNTIETPTTIEGLWDGILFFSPSAVRSFFTANRITAKTICFAIGETTATSISKYTTNKIIQSKTPDPLNIIKEVAVFFKTLSEHGIKE